MSRRLEVSFCHESKATGAQGTPYKNWYRCGIAHENDKGTITVRIRALPAAANEEGEYVFVIQEPFQKEGGGSGGFDKF